MKVLFTTNTPVPYRVDFFNELGKYCELTVLFETTSALDRNPSWIADKSVNFKAIFMKGKRVGAAEAFCPEILKHLSLKKYDVIVIGLYSSPTGMLAIEYMKTNRIPFILSSDGGMKKDDSGLKHWLKAHFIGSASLWLSTGKTTSEYLEYYGADADNIFVYPFTSVKEKDVVKSIISSEKKVEYRKQLDMTEEKIILSVGQFIHRKGYDILLRACKDIDKSIGVYIVGGKPTEEYLSMQDKWNLYNVHFLDFMQKEQLAKYYNAADLFVLPTREDIWGLVINEAMAKGLPIITTNKCVSGVEMVENGKSGYIINSDNVNELKNKICCFFENKCYSEFARNSLFAVHRYTIENMANEHFKVFEKFCHTKMTN